MKIAFVVPDNRDEFGQFELLAPVFGPAPQALLDGFAQLPNCEIHVISTTRQVTANPQKLAPNIFFHSLKLSPWSRLRTLNAGSTLAIRKLLREIRPDIVHGQGSERYPAIAAACSGFPNLITLHGIMSELAKIQKAPPLSWPRITAWVERRAIRRVDAVICLSNHAATVIQHLAKKTFVIPNAVADQFFEIHRAPANAIEIICPAHIYSIKNQPTLIRALDPLASHSHMPLKLTLLGKLTGDDTSHEVQQLAASRPWCHIAGPVDSAEIKEALSRATLLVLPSLEENCPVSILEGMAAGIPIAASRAGGIPDLIDDGVTGLLFDPRQPDSIRIAIERLLSEPAAAHQFASAARQRAENAFRPRAIAARHLEVYAQIARQR
ncbi:MAG TPA: glycosyltransferase family 4 protein [Verrucomicrobiae bacterium]